MLLPGYPHKQSGGIGTRRREDRNMNLGTTIVLIVWAFMLGLAIPIGWWAIAPYRCPTCGSHLRTPADER